MKMRLMLALLSVWSLLAVAAEGALRDPTRPADTRQDSSNAAPAVRVWHLDLVIRPVVGTASAVINGETYHVGDQVQDLRLLAIRESSVLLQGPDGEERVTLLPGVEKIMKQTQNNRATSRNKPGGGAQ